MVSRGRIASGLVAGSLAAVLVAAAAPEPPPAPTGAPAATASCRQQREALAQIDAVLARRPEDATLYFYRAQTWAACGDAAHAAEALAAVERYGAGFLVTPDLGFAKVWSDPALRARAAALERALPRVEQATVAFRVGGRDLIPEGIAWDPSRERLFIGSMARGEILVLERGGVERRFAGGFAGLGQILGLAVDGARHRLLAVGTDAIAHAGAGAPANAVLALDLDSGRLLGRLDAAGSSQLNDVTVAADGTVFASDSGAGGVWRAAPGAQALSRWLAAGTLPGANGLAVSADGRALSSPTRPASHASRSPPPR